MSTQRHIIKRQLIELTVQGTAQTQMLQDEISRIYHQRLIPLIDQCLTEMSDPDKLYRIDSLELNIGTLDHEHLEDDFVEKVSQSLRRELATQISGQEHANDVTRQTAGTNSHLELFAVFVRTGSLPWWAESSNPQLLAENVKYLLRDSPKALGPLLQELAREPHTRQRLVHQYTDEQLAELVGLLVPAYKLSIAGTFDVLIRVMQKVEVLSGWQVFQLRRSLWNNLLLVASLGGQEYTTLADFYQALFKRIAKDLGSTGKIFIAEMQQVLTNDETILATVTERKDNTISPVNASTSTPDEKGVDQAEARIDLRFSEADEVYVTNAGLVMLWPFLENFFAHVDLLEAKQFKDRSAQHRAVGLLQVLATRESVPPEYLLPLNKILCGLELEEVFDFGEPLLDSESEECERLLEAVIAQAPILHEMTTVGLRGSFLLRAGKLSVRDGLWLLQVEKETYDIVLERFPWSWQWVKLPWMGTPLRVEW